MLSKTPDEIRRMPVDDRNNLRMVSTAQKLAEAEMMKRA